MKYEVGDKVRVKFDTCDAASERIGTVGEVVRVTGGDMPYIVRFETIDEYGEGVQYYCDEELEHVDMLQVIERLNEVVAMLTKEQRRVALRGTYWTKVREGTTPHPTSGLADKRIGEASAEYDAIVARIEAVRKAIEFLS